MNTFRVATVSGGGDIAGDLYRRDCKHLGDRLVYRVG